MAKATQYQQLVDAVNVKDNGVKVNHVPGATAGSRLFYEVSIPRVGVVFLSADRRVTKVVLTATDGTIDRTIIKPKPEERAEVFALIAETVKGNTDKVEAAA